MVEGSLEHGVGNSSWINEGRHLPTPLSKNFDKTIFISCNLTPLDYAT